jgi:hypothetical protein
MIRSPAEVVPDMVTDALRAAGLNGWAVTLDLPSGAAQQGEHPLSQGPDLQRRSGPIGS